MTTFGQQLAGRYIAAGSDHAVLDAGRVARAVFVRDTLPTLYNADRNFGIDPADHGSLTELVGAAEEHLERIANDVSERSVMAPSTGGDTT